MHSARCLAGNIHLRLPFPSRATFCKPLSISSTEGSVSYGKFCGISNDRNGKSLRHYAQTQYRDQDILYSSKYSTFLVSFTQIGESANQRTQVFLIKHLITTNHRKVSTIRKRHRPKSIANVSGWSNQNNRKPPTNVYCL